MGRQPELGSDRIDPNRVYVGRVEAALLGHVALSRIDGWAASGALRSLHLVPWTKPGPRGRVYCLAEVLALADQVRR